MSNQTIEQIEQVKTSELTVHPLANRLPMLDVDHERFNELVADTGEEGILQPLIVDQNNRVIAGRHRLESARAASMETVPVIRMTVTDDETSSIMIKENVLRQDMTPGKRAITVVALHQEFFRDRKARQKACYLKGSLPGGRKPALREFPKENAISENPFKGDKSGLVHAKKWREMPTTVKELGQRYHVHHQDLAWAAHLWDAKDDPAAWKHIMGVWNGREALGAAYAGFMGGKAPQKKRGVDSKMRGWIDETQVRVKSMYKIQTEAPETFAKYHDDLLALFNDLRVLLEIPRETTGRHSKG